MVLAGVRFTTRQIPIASQRQDRIEVVERDRSALPLPPPILKLQTRLGVRLCSQAIRSVFSRFSRLLQPLQPFQQPRYCSYQALLEGSIGKEEPRFNVQRFRKPERSRQLIGPLSTCHAARTSDAITQAAFGAPVRSFWFGSCALPSPDPRRALLPGLDADLASIDNRESHRFINTWRESTSASRKPNTRDGQDSPSP